MADTRGGQLYRVGLRPYEAVEHVRRLLFVPPDIQHHDARIRAFLDNILIKETNRLSLPNVAQAATMWWWK